MTVHEGNCVVKFSTWPSSGTAVTNEGSAGSGYNATLSSNKYVALPHATAQKSTASGDYIDVAHGSAINNPTVATWEALFRWDTANTYSLIFSKDNGGSGYSALGLLVGYSSNTLYVERDQDASNSTAWTTPWTPVTGCWYHIQITWDMTSLSNTPVFKINNVAGLATSANVGTPTTFIDDSTFDLCLTNNNYHAQSTFNNYCTLTLFRWHNAILSDAYLQDNYNADISRIYEANCQVKYDMTEASTTQTNDGIAGASYNGTADSNRQAVWQSGADYWNFSANAATLYTPYGSVINSPTIASWEFLFYYNADTNANSHIWDKSATNGYFYFWIDTTNHRLYIKRAGTTTTNYNEWYTPSNSLTAAGLYHIVVVWNMNAWALTGVSLPIVYINNAVQSLTSASSSSRPTAWWNDATSNAMIGNRSDAGYRVNQKLFLYRYHNTLLTPGDVALAYSTEWWRYHNAVVAMTYPGTTYDDQVVVPSIANYNTVTVAMTCPGTTFDDVAVTPSIEQDRTVAMTYPGSTYDDQPVVASVSGGEVDCTVAMSCPGTTYDDVAPTIKLLDVDGAIVTNCVIEYIGDSFPASGTDIANVGTGGAAFDGTADANNYELLPSGAKAFHFSAADYNIIFSDGAAITNFTQATWEWLFKLDVGTSDDFYLIYKNSWFVRFNSEGGYIQIERYDVDWSNPASYYFWMDLPLGWYNIQVTWDCSNFTNKPTLKINGTPYTSGDSASGITAWASDAGGAYVFINNWASATTDLAVFRWHTVVLSDADLATNVDASNWRTTTVEQDCTVAMTYPGTTYDDAAVSASVEQDRSVAMTYPGITADDVAVAASIEQDRSVSMTYPGITSDDYVMAASIEQDRSVGMTYPNATCDDYTVVASIEQDRTVAMTYPDTAYDDQPVVPSVEQDRTVGMPYPTAAYDDQTVVASVEQDRSVSMTYPDSAYDDYAMTAAVEQDRSVAMAYPDMVADDYAVVASYTANPTVAMPYPGALYDVAAVVAGIQQDRTVSMPYPDTTYAPQVVVPSIIQGRQDCTVAMTYPGTTFDDYTVVASYTANLTVEMTYPSAAYEDYAVVASITQDRSIAMPYPTTQFDDYAVLPTVTQDRTVGMTSPSTTYDDAPTLASIRQDRSVVMSCPDVAVAVQPVVPSYTSNLTVAMSCPGTVYEAYAMTAGIQQDRSVYMPYPDAVLDDAPFDSVIAGHDCYVAMSYPSAEYDDAEAEVSVMQSRAVEMSFPSTLYDDAEVLAEVTESNPIVDMTFPGTIFDDVPVVVVILDTSTIIHVQGTLDSTLHLEGSLDSIHLEGCYGIIARVEGSRGVTAHVEGSIAMLEEQWIKDPPIRRGIYMAIEAPIWTDASKTTLSPSLSSGTVIWRLIGDFDSDLLVKTSDNPDEIAVDTPQKGYITIYIKGDETLDFSPGIYDHEAVIIVTDEAEGLFEGQAVVE